MAGSKIKTTITSTVTLGNGYASPLSITTTGAILPGGYGGYGIVLAASSKPDIIINAGLIAGANGAPGYPSGGYAGGGILLSGRSTLINSGQIFGGSGGDGDTYGGLGGRAVLVGATAQNVVIVNSGFIQGGAGGYGNQEAAPGATGVSIHAAN